jgi:hypothetical protein|tara:strand:+ start:2294 stop:2686 length:393 start_codon:yes stop_codon:yes gene_type:complete
MTKFLFSLDYFIKYNRQSLCGYCKAPAKGLLVEKEKDIYYAACSRKHAEKIMNGEKLNRKAYASRDGVRYATKQSKDKYIEIAKKSGTYVMHEWDSNDREQFFNEVVLNYLDWANEQAENGNIREIVIDG